MKQQSLWVRLQQLLGFRVTMTFPGKWKWRTLVFRRWGNERLLSIGKFRFDWRIGGAKPW